MIIKTYKFSGRYKKHCYISLVDEIILFMIIVILNFIHFSIVNDIICKSYLNL